MTNINVMSVLAKISVAIEQAERDGVLPYCLEGLHEMADAALLDSKPMGQEEMRAIFFANGFTVKEGQTDLKDYVYAAGRAIEQHHGIK